MNNNHNNIEIVKNNDYEYVASKPSLSQPETGGNIYSPLNDNMNNNNVMSYNQGQGNNMSNYGSNLNYGDVATGNNYTNFKPNPMNGYPSGYNQNNNVNNYGGYDYANNMNGVTPNIMSSNNPNVNNLAYQPYGANPGYSGNNGHNNNNFNNNYYARSNNNNGYDNYGRNSPNNERLRMIGNNIIK
jgi:hypothetical protein